MRLFDGPFTGRRTDRRSWGPPGPAAALLAAVLAAACGPDPLAVPVLVGGIQVNEPDRDVWVAAVEQAGLNAVQVTAYARQQAWDGAVMIVPEGSPAIVDEIRAAKRAGLRVVLVLRVALEQGLAENRHYWHGMIWPSDAELDDWFAAYRRFASWGARIAEQEAVDLLAIGSELNSLTSTVTLSETPGLYGYFLDPARTGQVRQRLVDCGASIPPEDLAIDLTFVDGGSYETLDAYLRAQEEADRRWARHITGATSAQDVDLVVLNARRARLDERWRGLIAELRAEYSGPLSYAANFDQVEEVGFWDALDSIGVNAYYPLSRWGATGTALEEALTASWAAVAARLDELAARYGGPGRVLPVLLFELGWTRKAGSTVRPFSYHRVEVLETVGPTGGPTTLTCVHWATQPEDPFERVHAMAALQRVVEQGRFPTLRGFMLWKLSTLPEHRDVEPFVVTLPADRDTGGRAIAADAASDAADRRFVEIAADLRRRLERAR